MNKASVVCAAALSLAAVLGAQPPSKGVVGGVTGAPGGGVVGGVPGGVPGGVRGVVGGWPAAPALVTGAPYSGLQVTEMHQTLSNGNQIQQRTETKIYRDGQGRVRWERVPSTPPKPGESLVVIFDPAARVMLLLNPANQTFQKMPLRRPQAAPARARRGNSQLVKEEIEPQVVNGLQTTGTRTTETIPAGAIGNAQPIQITREVRIATALKVPALIKSSDPRFGQSTMQLTNIAMGEPDPALFQVPANYTPRARTQP
jgi:hypothetical protein